jgi:hypothetical protein
LSPDAGGDQASMSILLVILVVLVILALLGFIGRGRFSS